MKNKPTSTPTESPAAILAKMRWAKTTKKERTEHAKMMNRASQSARGIGIYDINREVDK